MTLFFCHLCKRLLAIVIFGILLSVPSWVFAIGLSPSEVELGHIHVGSAQTVRAQITRAPNEMGGSMRITVNPRKSAAGFFFGEPSFIIPEGTKEFNYLFSVIPNYVQDELQELYVTFLVESSSSVSSGVSVKTGATQVIRFTTDVDFSSQPLTELTVTPILGGVSAGAICEAFRTDTGALLGLGFTDISGTCSIILPRSYTGIVIVRVKGGPGVKYYDERTGALADFTAEQAVISAVAPSVWNTPSAQVSTPVTALTTIVAAKAGIVPSAASSTLLAPALTTDSLTQAIIETLPILGLSAENIDIYKTPPSSAFFQVKDEGIGKKLAGSADQLSYGVALTAVANITPSGTSLGDFTLKFAKAVQENNVASSVPEITQFQQTFQSVAQTVVEAGAQIGVIPSAPASVPDRPIVSSVINSNGQAILMFIPPVNNGGTVITSYTVTCTSPNRASVSAFGTSSPITVIGLINGVVYSCSILAHNAIGSSVLSDVVSTEPYLARVGGTSGGVSRRGRETNDGQTDSQRPKDAISTPKTPLSDKRTIPRTSDGFAGGDSQVQQKRDALSEKSPTSGSDSNVPIVHRPERPPTSSIKEITPSLSREIPVISESIISDKSVQRPLPRAHIESPSHPSEEKFVSNSDATFFLRETGEGKDSPIKFLLNSEQSAKTSELVYETHNPSVSFHLTDGVYYLHTLGAGDISGEVETRRVMIDTTPPSVAANTQFTRTIPLLAPKQTIVIDTFDELAGVSDIQATVNGASVPLHGNQISTRGMGFGTHTLTVKATDTAGNIVNRLFAIDVLPKYPIAQVVSRIPKMFIRKISSLFNRR